MAVARPFDKMTLDQLTSHLYFFSKLQMKSLKEREREREEKHDSINEKLADMMN